VTASVGVLQNLPNLRVLDLSNSTKLIKLPDLRGVPNHEWISLDRCRQLESIHPSICLLRKLAFLSLMDCENLVSLPLFALNYVKDLNISYCPRVFDNQNFKTLDIRETSMQSQSTPSSIFKKRIVHSNFSHYRGYKNSGGCLSPSLPSFFCMQDLNLSFCNLTRIPDAIGSIHSLEKP